MKIEAYNQKLDSANAQEKNDDACKETKDCHSQHQSTPLFDNQFYTVEKLSKFLSVPEATIRDWVYKRQIPFKKLGRLIRFDPSDIQKWLNERSHDVH